MMGGEASLIVALADSFFFDVDPDAARGRVLLFLLISFAPFLFVAPLIGPLIDQMRGGRRFVVMLVAAFRAVLQIVMIRVAGSIALFPLVFIALVLQKTYTVSKSALVPSVVRNDTELVEANSKLGLIAGVTGAVAVVPAALLQVLIGTGATLFYGALLFVAAFVAATRLPRDTVVVSAEEARRPVPALPPGVHAAAAAMFVLRCSVGFLLFHLAFWFRSEDAATFWFATAVSLSSIGTLLGNAVGPHLRRRVTEEHMIVAVLLLAAVTGVVTAFVGNELAGVALAAVLNFVAAIARLAFESIVQRDAPGVNRGQTFARFETRFQLGWVAAATLPVLLPIPSSLGLLAVGVLAGVALFRYRAGSRATGRAGNFGVSRP